VASPTPDRKSAGIVIIFATFAEEPGAHSTSAAVGRAISWSGSRTAHDAEVALQLVLIDTGISIYIAPLIRSIGCIIGVTIPSAFISDRCS
jgi:hypothetical protein